MATLGASIKVGESIAALLRTRRDLAAASGTLAPVPANIEIAQTTVGKLAAGAAPTAGLGLLCFDVVRSDHPAPTRRSAASLPRPEIALELLFLLIAWSGKSEEEHAALAWAMLELDANAVLDSSVLLGNVWDPGETIHLAPEPYSPEDQFRLWDALGHKYRMAQAYRARVLRIRMPDTDDAMPIAASRFALSDHVEPEVVS